MNSNLIDIVGLVPEDKLDWTPAPTEWSIRVIVVHIILARHHHVAAQGAPPDFISTVIQESRTREGLQRHLASSWDLLDSLLSDEAKLNATYESPVDSGPEYVGDPEVYDGHYVAYHRFAHDLHHRSTLMGHIRQLEIPIADHLIRPLD